jgi:hypothetical protein
MAGHPRWYNKPEQFLPTEGSLRMFSTFNTIY